MKLHLPAGTPDDLNREYLPEKIKHTDIVVNENGNNSLPWPERLKECTGVLVDGVEDRWYEYVPASYDGTKPVPLVVGCHGGLMTGWGHAIYTSWTMVADREGFICVFPSAHAQRFWQIMCEPELKGVLSAENPEGIFLNDFPEDIRKNHDANLILALLERMKQNYNIDEGRVYMQGMSLGNAMTQMMARFYAHKFAAVAGSAGPARKTLLFKADGTPEFQSLPVDAWQTRMELDQPAPACTDDYEDVIAYNRDYWLKIIGCTALPRIRLFGENGLAFFRGERADYVFRDVKNRDHGQTFDDAELVWDYCFSGVRRAADGTIVHTRTDLPTENDAVAVAAVAGCRRAWVNGEVRSMAGAAFLWQKLKYHGLNSGEMVRGEYVCVPVRFLAQVFGGTYETDMDGLRGTMTLPDGRVLRFARGVIGCQVDEDLVSMYCETLHREGELLVSAEWFCRYLFNLHVSVCNNVVYVTDHFAELSEYMAELIKELLK